jgi:hypothetical protein
MAVAAFMHLSLIPSRVVVKVHTSRFSPDLSNQSSQPTAASNVSFWSFTGTFGIRTLTTRSLPGTRNGSEMADSHMLPPFPHRDVFWRS